jgi:hypothetical protein
MNYEDTSNDTIEEQFLYEIDRSIETGDSKYIITAIKKYSKVINNSYLIMATNILTQLAEETFENMEI